MLVNPQLVEVLVFMKAHGVVQVFGIRPVDGEDHLRPQIRPPKQLLFRDPLMLQHPRFVQHRRREFLGHSLRL